MFLFGPPNVEKMRAKENVKGLIKALKYTKDAGIREAAARALGEIGDPKAVEPLIAALKDNSEVGCAAAIALGNTSDARAVQPLIDALREGKGPMRDAVAIVLGAVGGPAVKPLIDTLKDKDWYVRQVALGVLERIGTPDAKDALVAYKNSRPKMPAGLPGPLPHHEFASSSNQKEAEGPGASEFQTALGHWSAGRYDQAMEHYIKAIDLGLTSVYEAASRDSLGKIFLMQENVGAAVDQFIKALYLKPLTASTAYSCSAHLALIYEELGMAEDTQAAFESAKMALKQADSVIPAEAAEKVRETVRQVYK